MEAVVALAKLTSFILMNQAIKGTFPTVPKLTPVTQVYPGSELAAERFGWIQVNGSDDEPYTVICFKTKIKDSNCYAALFDEVRGPASLSSLLNRSLALKVRVFAKSDVYKSQVDKAVAADREFMRSYYSISIALQSLFLACDARSANRKPNEVILWPSTASHPKRYCSSWKAPHIAQSTFSLIGKQGNDAFAATGCVKEEAGKGWTCMRINSNKHLCLVSSFALGNDPECEQRSNGKSAVVPEFNPKTDLVETCCDNGAL